MRKTLHIGIAVLVFFGCSKSGSSPSTSQVGLVGKWTAVNEFGWGQIIGATTAYRDTVTAYPGEYVQFGSDGKQEMCVWNQGLTKYQYDTVPWSVNGNVLTDPDFPDGSTIVFSAHSLTITNIDPMGEDNFQWNYAR